MGIETTYLLDLTLIGLVYPRQDGTGQVFKTAEKNYQWHDQRGHHAF
jgi:hypothetical protein